jgi:hypothetical protein
LYVGLVLALALVWAHPAVAQIPAPSGASIETRADFSGTWTLDRDLSNDPGQAGFDNSQDRRVQGTTRRGGGFGGIGGRGQRGGSGSRSPNSVDGSSTPDERARLAALTEQLKKASATLTISHHDSSLVINDAQDHTQFFHTTGAEEQQLVGGATIASTTRWDGERVVTEYALSSRRTLVYTYTLLPRTNQMVLRVRLDVRQGPRANGSELKLVYKRAPSPSK